jgi:riboflavin kinase/FMN adenylyltransferase
MQILQQPAPPRPPRSKVCLAIGVFDGVHLGHQQIIRQTVSDARQCDALAVGVTFDRHPHAIVAPDRLPPLIYSRSQKLRAIAGLGADVLLELPFNTAMSQLTGTEFIHRLVREFGGLDTGTDATAGPIASICVGADFVFGNQRSGNVALLRELGGALGFRVHGLAAVALDGQTVSSTRIRERIRAGDFDAASQMLGRSYSLAGPVVRGDQLGRQLGCPTANLDLPGQLLPPRGVYAGLVQRRAGGDLFTTGSGPFRAVINIGMRPTVSQPTPEPRVEIHLLDFAGDLYGEELEITFVAKLRDEQKFPSLAALKQQIAADISAARPRLPVHRD